MPRLIQVFTGRTGHFVGFVDLQPNNHQSAGNWLLLTISGIGTSNWVPEGACIANNVSPLKHRHISSCETYANLTTVKESRLIATYFWLQNPGLFLEGDLGEKVSIIWLSFYFELKERLKWKSKTWTKPSPWMPLNFSQSENSRLSPGVHQLNLEIFDLVASSETGSGLSVTYEANV